MSIAILCPKCRASLKANKRPRSDKLLQCLKCQHRFFLSESADHAASRFASNEPRSLRVADELLRKPLVLAGMLVAGVVIVGGIAAATLSMRSADATSPPKPSVAVVERPVVVEAKSDKATEVKASPKADLELERRRQLFTHLMIDGGIATQLKQFDQAVAAYTDAGKLFPDSAEAQAKLIEAKTGWDLQEKARRENEQSLSDVTALIKRGQDSLDKEQFAAAIDFFKLALAKLPTNEEAAEKLVLAQDRLRMAEVERKTLADFDQHILVGKQALQAGRSADAIREFAAAGKLMPNDPLPADLMKEAEKQFVQAKTQDDRKKQFQAFVDQGANFLRAKANEDAEDSFRQALKLFPNDAAALRGMESAQAALKKSQIEVINLMNQAQAAVLGGQLPTAMASLREAEKIAPNNPDVRRAIRAAETIQINQAVYFQAMSRASAAMAVRSYGNAIVAYSDALAIVPNDPFSAVGLLEAQRGLEMTNRKKLEYDGLVNQAVAALKGQRYSDAARLLESAVRMMRPPLLVDPQVQSLARYAEAMAQGNNALNARQFPQAAQYFQLALNEIPNDLTAQGALQRARLGIKR